jgi:hypothetical protein
MHGFLFRRAPCRTPQLERRIEAALPSSRWHAGTIAEIPLEQGSP